MTGPETAPERANTTATPKRPSLKRLWPLLAVAAAIAAFFALGLDDYLSFEALKTHRQEILDWYARNHVLAVASFIVAYALAVALSVPGAVWMSLAAGFVFGTVKATIVVVFAATVGALGIFLIARYALADFFHEKAGDAGHRMEAGFQENALSYLLFLRLVPLFPFWLVNLVPALLGVPARVFVIGTFLGIIPGTAVFCSVGNGLGMVFEKGGMPDMNIIFEPQILGPIVALAVLSLVPIVYKRIKAARRESG